MQSLVKIVLLLLTTGAGAGVDLGPEYEKLSWFVHITDLHISSRDQDQVRVADLTTFVTEVLAIIRPEFVMCGGDLTEARARNPLVTGQVQWEWETYRNITDLRWNSLPWLDIRGNHDNFNVLSRASRQNYFANYSVMGREGELHSYNRRFRSRGQQFNVVAVDATLELGLSYPFNFVGQINQEEQEILNQIVSDIQEDEIPIFFGHYPSSVVRQSHYLRSLISRALVYLSGHLHDLGIALYTFHNNSDLELELVDWKLHRKFRLLAVHHGRLSFVDVKLGDWPIVLVSSPKDSRIMMERKENYTDYLSNPISVLVFNITDVARVEISLDGGEGLEARRQGSGPLYQVSVQDWSSFSHGVHHLAVTVVSADGSEKTVSQEFSLSPAEANLLDNRLANFVLRSSFTSLFHSLYWLTLILNITVPLGLKIIYHLAHTDRLSERLRKIFQSGCRFGLFRKLMLVASRDVIFFSLLVIVLYLAVGPWVVGTLVEANTGAVFAWGVLVDKQLVEAQVPFAFYFLHCGILHPVMVLVVGQILDIRNGVRGWRGPLIISILLLIVTAFSVLTSLNFWFQYGLLGFLVGPLKTWSHLAYSLIALLAWRTGDKQLAQGYRRALSLHEGRRHI